MNLKLFIKKPVLAVTLCLLIILLGTAAYLKLPVRQFPLLPASKVTITTVYPGASPQVMEGFVSQPMEESLSGLEHLDYISSSNQESQSLVTLKFHLGTDIDAILPQISNRISSLKWQLPKNINDPIITKIDPNSAATGAILYIDGHSTLLSEEQMTEYLKRTVIPRFEAVAGVAKVEMFGKREYAMRIWLDTGKMAALGVSASDVANALLTHNLRSAPGMLQGKYMEFDVSTNSNLSTAEAFNNIVIKRNNGQYVRISDIGKAQLGATDYQTSAYTNGKPTVMMGVMPTDSANSIATAKRVLVSLKSLQAVLPPAMNVSLVWDVTQFARQSIKEVHLTIIEAAFFVFIVVFLFLGSLRSIIVPMVTIPLSMLGAAAIMWVMDYSLNTLTLLAWVLAIGLVVDDAIVVLENIHRHTEMGKSRLQAAIDGVTELKHPIIAITLAVAIVFTPIGFVPGISGALFKEFAFTISLVVIVSGILALFVSPVMCTRLLPRQNTHGHLTKFLDKTFNVIRIHYQNVLEAVLEMRWLVLIIFVLLIFSGIKIFAEIPSELIPTENEGVLIGMGMGPSSANLGYLERFTLAFNDIYQELPEHQVFGLFNGISLIGQTNAISWVLLKPENKRKRTEDQILTILNNEMKRIPGILAFAMKQPTIPGAMPGQPVKFVLKTSGDYAMLSTQIQRLKAAATKYPGLTDPNTTFKMDKPQINVVIDRQKAAALGVQINDIANTLSVMMGKPIINRFGVEGYSYEVIPQTFPRFRVSPNDINGMYVRAANSSLVPLSNLVTIKETVAPQTLDEMQQLRSATLDAGIADGYTMGEVLNFLENYVRTQMPTTMSYDSVGQTREFIQSKGALLSAFIFALVLIYLLLAAHFNSFRDPFVVMLSVPLAITGAIFVMFLTDCTLNIYTKIGLIMLVGLISKHGILIVDFANKLQEEGRDLCEAVIEAAHIRLRPILMTTAAMISGALPLVLSHGAGSIARSQIGWVIIGGMSLGTTLTLFVVPTAYTLLAARIKPHD